MNKKIAAITTCRNDEVFLRKWVQYYGAAFGELNIFVVLDGHDQAPIEALHERNVFRLPHQPLERVAAMRRRANVMSDIARGLHRYFDIVIATDVDEFLLLDPKAGDDLGAYLSRIEGRSSVSGLGLDVAQKLGVEEKIDLEKPILGQRRFAHLSARYTKPSTSFRPVRWGSGMHRIKGRNFHIDPNLFHVHLGMMDYHLATGKTADKDRLSTGWGEHLERREQVFKIVEESPAQRGDDYFATARKLQTWRRPLYAINKPGMIKSSPVVELPERFFGLL